MVVTTVAARATSGASAALPTSQAARHLASGSLPKRKVLLRCPALLRAGDPLLPDLDPVDLLPDLDPALPDLDPPLPDLDLLDPPLPDLDPPLPDLDIPLACTPVNRQPGWLVWPLLQRPRRCFPASLASLVATRSPSFLTRERSRRPCHWIWW